MFRVRKMSIFGGAGGVDRKSGVDAGGCGLLRNGESGTEVCSANMQRGAEGIEHRSEGIERGSEGSERTSEAVERSSAEVERRSEGLERSSAWSERSSQEAELRSERGGMPGCAGGAKLGAGGAPSGAWSKGEGSVRVSADDVSVGVVVAVVLPAVVLPVANRAKLEVPALREGFHVAAEAAVRAGFAGQDGAGKGGHSGEG